MTREHKLALVVGFGLILFVGILLSDHLRQSTREHDPLPSAARSALWSMPDTLEPREPVRLADTSLKKATRTPAPMSSIPTRPKQIRGAEVDSPAIITLETASERSNTIIASVAQEQKPPVSAPIVPRAPSFSTHTIGDGETLQDISMVHFGTTRRWQEIAQINDITKPDRIRPGTRLRLPGVETTRTATVTPVAQPSVKTYQVQKGDTLMAIAHKTLGSTTRWVDIRDLNAIEDPMSLRLGQNLKIPSR